MVITDRRESSRTSGSKLLTRILLISQYFQPPIREIKMIQTLMVIITDFKRMNEKLNLEKLSSTC